MAANSSEKLIKIDADIVDFVIIQAMGDIKARLATSAQVKEEASLLHLNAMASLMRYLNDGGFLSVDGFFADIHDEYQSFLNATTALRAKVMEVSVLYLDAELKPHKDEGTWSSYHSNEE